MSAQWRFPKRLIFVLSIQKVILDLANSGCCRRTRYSLSQDQKKKEADSNNEKITIAIENRNILIGVICLFFYLGHHVQRVS